MSARTTILVLSVDEAPLLEYCLPAAAAQPGAELVVIDNACADATARVAAAHGARVVRLSERYSYAAAMNRGLAACDGDAVLLLNADCVLDAGFLGAARAHLDADARLGSVAPRLVRTTAMEPAGRLHELDAAGMVVDRRRKNALVGHGAPASAYARPGEAFGGDGACVLYRRAALDDCAIGGEVFDEDFELWASDADLAWRARLLGWRCRYEPAAVAWHMRFYRPGVRDALPERHRRLQFRNRLLMLAKNETPAGLLRDLPWIAGYEVLALGHALLRERHLLGGYREALALLPRARARRRAIQPRRARGRVPFGLTPPR